MTFLHAIILGVIEGITEFLPISSTGHLILTNQLLGIVESNFVKSFDIAIQLGAILAVAFLYGKKLYYDHELLKRVAVAFVPTAIIGLALHGLVKKYLLGNTSVVLTSLLIGGLVIILFEQWLVRKEAVEVRIEHEDGSPIINYQQAVVVGLAQSVAIIPGVSRSAATVVGGLALGLPRKTIVEFSFLLAIPTMVAATSLDLLKTGFVFSAREWELILVGALVSGSVALVAIKWLLRYIAHHTFSPFGWYRIAVALIGFWFILP